MCTHHCLFNYLFNINELEMFLLFSNLNIMAMENFYLRPKWSNRDQIYSPTWKKNILKTIIFKKLFIRQWKTVTPERWETTKVSQPFSCSRFLPWESVQVTVWGWLTQVELDEFSELSRKSWKSRETRWQKHRDFWHREQTLEILRRSFWSS